MSRFFADFHIHIGQSHNRPVKIPAAKNLTVGNALYHAAAMKGLQIVTLIDGVCPPVQDDLRVLIHTGDLRLAKGGGYLYREKLLVLPGAEIEVPGPQRGAAHFGCWFPSLEASADFTGWLKTVQKNVNLSSQRIRGDAQQLQNEVRERQGLFIVHHAFTPHKGLYGSCVSKMSDMLDVNLVDALELGLSADTQMADCLSELRKVSFLSNSDAHSLPKIAREYNELELETLSFAEIRLALLRRNRRRIVGNYGLDPRLGKYHRSTCNQCGRRKALDKEICACGCKSFTQGVWDRWFEIKDLQDAQHPGYRPPYHKQIPLEFVPGLGPLGRKRLLEAFGSEMAVLHWTTESELAQVCGEPLAQRIHLARTGRLSISAGGGGVYGKLLVN